MQIGNPRGIAYASNSIGEILMTYYKSKDAEKYLQQAFENSNLAQDRNLQKTTSENLFEFFSNKGDYKKALSYYTKFSNTQYDSVIDQLDKRKISEIAANYEISKNKSEIKDLKEYNQMQSILIYLFILVIISAIIIGYVTWRNIKFRKESEKILEEKNSKLEEINSRLKESDIILRDLNLTKDKVLHIISNDLREPFKDFKNISNQLVDSIENPVKNHQKRIGVPDS